MIDKNTVQFEIQLFKKYLIKLFEQSTCTILQFDMVLKKIRCNVYGDDQFPPTNTPQNLSKAFRQFIKKWGENQQRTVEQWHEQFVSKLMDHALRKWCSEIVDDYFTINQWGLFSPFGKGKSLTNMFDK